MNFLETPLKISNLDIFNLNRPSLPPSHSIFIPYSLLIFLIFSPSFFFHISSFNLLLQRSVVKRCSDYLPLHSLSFLFLYWVCLLVRLFDYRINSSTRNFFGFLILIFGATMAIGFIGVYSHFFCDFLNDFRFFHNI